MPTCILYQVINYNLSFPPLFPCVAFFSKNPTKTTLKSRLLVYDELLQSGGDNVNICWWDLAAWVRLQKYGIWIKEKKKALVNRLTQSQVTSALELLISTISLGKLSLPEWLCSTRELSHWPVFVYLAFSRHSVWFTCFVMCVIPCLEDWSICVGNTSTLGHSYLFSHDEIKPYNKMAYTDRERVSVEEINSPLWQL